MRELEKAEQLALEIFYKEYPQSIDILEFKLWERMRDNFVRGFIEGYLEESYRIAHKLLDVLDDEVVAKVTGLPIEEVKRLRNESIK